jgi:hypothetical protein
MIGLMLSDKDAEEIRSSVEGGTRGPVLLKWIRQLLEDRDARVKREKAAEAGPESPNGPKR